MPFRQPGACLRRYFRQALTTRVRVSHSLEDAVVRSVLFNTAVSGALSLALVSLLGTLSGSAIAQTPGRAVHATPQLLRASSAFVTPTAALAPVASALALPPASLFTGPAPAGAPPLRRPAAEGRPHAC